MTACTRCRFGQHARRKRLKPAKGMRRSGTAKPGSRLNWSYRAYRPAGIRFCTGTQMRRGTMCRLSFTKWNALPQTRLLTVPAKPKQLSEYLKRLFELRIISSSEIVGIDVDRHVGLDA